MNIDLLEYILSIPTYFGREEKIKDFLVNYAKTKSIDYQYDDYGNLYLIKGDLYSAPCVVAHMDTVYKDHIKYIDNNQILNVKKRTLINDIMLFAHDSDGNNIGIGGDDKSGIFICLEMLNKFENIVAAFFVEEEFGCYGAKNANTSLLKDVGYFIEFDAPYDKWFTYSSNGVVLFSNDMFNKVEDILFKNKVKMTIDPYTDVHILTTEFNIGAFNVSAGYVYPHSMEEYVSVNYIKNSINFGYELIKKLGVNRYEHNQFSIDYNFFKEKQAI